MGRNNADFDYGITPDIKDVIIAHTRDRKITSEEAMDLHEGFKDRMVAAHGRDLLSKGPNEPNIRPTKPNRIKEIHKRAGLNE